MTFSYTQYRARVQGAGDIVYGTFTNNATHETNDIGGDIATGADNSVATFVLGLTGTAVEATCSVVNEDFPAPRAVSIVNGTGDDGTYLGIVR